jgi:hypothetical protein
MRNVCLAIRNTVKDAAMVYGLTWNARAQKTVWDMNIAIMDCAGIRKGVAKLIRNAHLAITAIRKKASAWSKSAEAMRNALWVRVAIMQS